MRIAAVLLALCTTSCATWELVDRCYDIKERTKEAADARHQRDYREWVGRVSGPCGEEAKLIAVEEALRYCEGKVKEDTHGIEAARLPLTKEQCVKEHAPKILDEAADRLPLRCSEKIPSMWDYRRRAKAAAIKAHPECADLHSWRSW